MLSCPSVSKNREEVNCVPLSVVNVKRASRLPSGGDRPRFSSCPSARSDWARPLPHGPTLSFFVRADDASAPATHVRASPVTPACDSQAGLSSAAATRPLADSRTPASPATPPRPHHRRFGQLGCLAAASGNTDSTGYWPT